MQYLQQHASADSAWSVDVHLTADQARMLADPGAKIVLAGGEAPWTGSQRFDVTIDTTDGAEQFSLDADVATPSEMVVAVRSLSRGVKVRATDVELRRMTPDEDRCDAFCSVDEVVGKQTTRSIPKDKVLRPEMLRSPLLVRRGDVVTVTASNAGIRIRTTARAREDGGLGELIAVESFSDRKPYFVRVAGVREAEVFGRAIQANANKRLKLAQGNTRTAGNLDHGIETRGGRR